MWFASKHVKIRRQHLKCLCVCVIEEKYSQSYILNEDAMHPSQFMTHHLAKTHLLLNADRAPLRLLIFLSQLPKARPVSTAW